MLRRFIVWVLSKIAPKKPRRPAVQLQAPRPVVTVKRITAADIKERLYAGEDSSGIFENTWGTRK